MSNSQTAAGGRSRSKIVSLLAVIAIGMAAMFADTGTAEAVTVRPGAQAFQVDMLLDEYETDKARQSFWNATVICWDAGVVGWTLSIGVCQSMVSVCAAQAYYATPRKRAGITFAPGTAWCWKY